MTYAYNVHAVRTHSTDRTVSYSSRTHHTYTTPTRSSFYAYKKSRNLEWKHSCSPGYSSSTGQVSITINQLNIVDCYTLIGQLRQVVHKFVYRITLFLMALMKLNPLKYEVFLLLAKGNGEPQEYLPTGLVLLGIS